MTMAFEAPATLSGDEHVLSVYSEEQDDQGVPAEEIHQEDAAQDGEQVAGEQEASESVVDYAEDHASESNNAPTDEQIDTANAALQEPADEADEDTFWDELELLAELADAERKAQELESELLSLTEERKATKKQYESAVINVREVAAQITNLMRGKRLPKKPAATTSGAAVGGATSESEPSAEIYVTGADENAWRNCKTEELLAGVQGLGSKKMETISELAPTAGHLENLRAEASKAHKAFKEVLPKGFGEAVAQAIEDRLLDHIAKQSTPSAASQVEPRGNQGEPEPAPTPNEEAEHLDSLLAEIEEDAAREEWSLNDTELDEEADSQAVHDGFAAYVAGRPHRDCDDPHNQRDWMTGWVLARLRERLLKQAEGEDDGDGEPPADQ
jgi:hypothetical protein